MYHDQYSARRVYDACIAELMHLEYRVLCRNRPEMSVS
jgi:hypothetical protein